MSPSPAFPLLKVAGFKDERRISFMSIEKYVMLIFKSAFQAEGR